MAANKFRSTVVSQIRNACFVVAILCICVSTLIFTGETKTNAYFLSLGLFYMAFSIEMLGRLGGTMEQASVEERAELEHEDGFVEVPGKGANMMLALLKLPILFGLMFFAAQTSGGALIGFAAGVVLGTVLAALLYLRSLKAS